MPLREQLRVLAIIHFAVAGLAALALILNAGAVMLSYQGIKAVEETFKGMPAIENDPPSGQLLVRFAMVSGFLFATAVLLAVAGKCLISDRNPRSCRVAAALECLALPAGTILGIITLSMISKPEAISPP